jgi:hypothetical protein
MLMVRKQRFEQKLRAIENRQLILAKTEICGFLSKNHHGHQNPREC